MVPCSDSCQHAAAEFYDPGNNFIHWLLNQYFLPIEQCDDRVRTLLHKLDEVRIHSERRVVEPSQVNHGTQKTARAALGELSAAEFSEFKPVTNRGLPKFLRYGDVG
jgi:hypothetical protein